jgi:hypothetical protein
MGGGQVYQELAGQAERDGYRSFRADLDRATVDA